MKPSALVLFIVLSSFVAVAGAGGNIGTGKKLYVDFGCYGCHGYNATMRVPLVGGESSVMADEQLFLAYLRLRGDQNPVNPKNTMPNYDASTLTDDQARDIYAYISSLDDDLPDIEDIPVFVEILESASRGSGNEGNDP